MRERISKGKEKLHNQAGFTLAETLVTILILLMVSSVVATGIPAAINAYNKVVLASNAEVLLSTAISSLRNELGTSSDIETSGGTGGGSDTIITYYNEAIRSRSKIFKADGTNDKEPDGTVIHPDSITYQQYADDKLNKAGGGIKTSLVSSAASTEDLYVTYDSVTYDKNKGVVTFDNLKVKAVKLKDDAGNDRVMASLPKKADGSAGTLSVRLISY